MFRLVALAFAGCLICAAGANAGDGPYAGLRGGKTARAGKSNMGHLVLFEKDPATWEIVDKGAFGKMNYRTSGSELRFVFNGHKLEPEVSYTLLYYPDPWPGEGLICLGEAVADEDGNVHLRTTADTCDLPAPYDENVDLGAKIWLVLSADVDCVGDGVEAPRMIGWNPMEYLFEYELITFDDTDSMWDDMGYCVAEED